MPERTIIEKLQDADKTLEADGYKSWSYVRLAISEAIEVFSKQENAQINPNTAP